jgi:hypothetical protein
MPHAYSNLATQALHEQAPDLLSLVKYKYNDRCIRVLAYEIIFWGVRQKCKEYYIISIKKSTVLQNHVHYREPRTKALSFYVTPRRGMIRSGALMPNLRGPAPGLHLDRTA